MKLYEFTVTDEHNLSKSKILEIAELSAADESSLREWSNFKVIESRDPECLPNGATRYSFEVEGEYALSSSLDADKQTRTTIYTSRGSVAAAEL